jgi:tetrahydromethanopterin S-methyltransferase subunit F
MYNDTFQISAFWVSDIENEGVYIGFSPGDIAGIVIGCTVSLIMAGILIRTIISC